MSTRSRIAKLNEDGSIRVIYCHSDGYLDYNGRILLTHYTDPAKVDALLDLGDISSLAEEIGEKHPFDIPYKFNDPYHKAEKEFTAKYGKMTRAYGRDRGEKDIEAQVYPSLAEFPDSHCEEFFYLHTPDGWKWFPGDRKNHITLLTQEVIEGDITLLTQEVIEGENQ